MRYLVRASWASGTIAPVTWLVLGRYGHGMVPSTPQRTRIRPARLPRRLSVFVSIAFAATALGTLALPAATFAWDANSFSASDEQALFALTNQARASAGLPTLSWDSSLASLARWRSQDMIVRDYFSHQIPPSGSSVFDEMSARGYCFKVAGENIGWNNYPDDSATAQIQQMFMNSSGHRANILGSAWDVAGIGAYQGSDGKRMWTVLFADKCGTTATPAPTPKPTIRPTATATPRPTPNATSQPTPNATSQPTPNATSQPTPNATSQPTPVPASQPSPTVTPTPTPTPTASPTPSPVPTAEPSQSPSASGPQGTGSYLTPSLRVLDQPAPAGLLESIFGVIAGFFFGG